MGGTQLPKESFKEFLASFPPDYKCPDSIAHLDELQFIRESVEFFLVAKGRKDTDF